MISTEQYIESLEEMIATPGWTILVEESKKQIYQLQADALEAPTWEQVLRKRGQAEQLAELCSLEDMVANQRAEMEMEAIMEDENAAI